jgi:serine/threonine protein kinase
MSSDGCCPAWTEVGPYFEQALELAEELREDWLAEIDATRPGVARAVRGLLAEWAIVTGAGFLREPLFSKATTFQTALHQVQADRVPNDGGTTHLTLPNNAAFGWVAGTIIGPYRLIRQIGSGGMSSVWLAERCDGQIKRAIALKLPFMGPAMQVERFMRERDILAALTHPQIARLYDAGIADSGQTYLAMEYVQGTALVHDCDERRLTIRERLRVFLQVLEAVQFAHAGLVIHRDLKPSNILVTPQGRVVLLDFGIGKLLTEGTAQVMQLTDLAARALTPDYASPEQIGGQALGTASDIYSLGVILYELLTGRRPYRPRRASPAALEEAILSDDLRRPSLCRPSAEAAAARNSSTRALVRALAGDLDTIVLKALERAPLERYASVTAFAQDIDNYLHNLPVSARPSNRWYRIGCFVSRYKLPVLAASITVLAMLAGTWFSVWQARIVAVERDRATSLAARNESVTEFLGTVITQAAASLTPITVSELLKRAEHLAMTNKRTDAETRAAVLGMIADRYGSLEDFEHATRLLQFAIELLDRSPDQALRSRYICDLSLMHAGAENFRTMLPIITREVAAHPADQSAAVCLLDLTILAEQENLAADAIQYAQRGLDLLGRSPQHSALLEAALLSRLTYAHSMKGHSIEAARLFERALRNYTALGQESSDGALTLMNDWASAITRKTPKRALELFEQIERIEREREFGAEIGTTLTGNKANALQLLGRVEAAQASYEMECRLADQRRDLNSKLQCQYGLASLMLDVSQPAAASKYLEQAIATAAVGGAPSYWPRLRAIQEGRLDLLAGRLTQARANFEQAGPRNTDVWGYKVETELAAAKPKVAAELARQALRISKSLQGDSPYSRETGMAWLMLGRALQQLQDPAQAHAAFAAALAQLSNTVDADHPQLLQVRQLLDVGSNAADPGDVEHPTGRRLR